MLGAKWWNTTSVYCCSVFSTQPHCFPLNKERWSLPAEALAPLIREIHDSSWKCLNFWIWAQKFELWLQRQMGLWRFGWTRGVLEEWKQVCQPYGMFIPVPLKWLTVTVSRALSYYHVSTLENSHKIDILLFHEPMPSQIIMQTVVLDIVKWLIDLELKDVIHLLIQYQWLCCFNGPVNGTHFLMWWLNWTAVLTRLTWSRFFWPNSK